jgi:hypothetical protein
MSCAVLPASRSDESFYGDKGAEGGRDDDHRKGEPR